MWNEYLYYKNGKLYWKISTNRNAKAGSKVGGKCSNGYISIGLLGKRYYAHRVIWEMHNGPIPKELTIDHINGVRDDNRIENLQLLTQTQNNQRRFNTKGYSLHRGKYLAQKKFNRKEYNLGVYGTKCGAYMAHKLFFIKRRITC